MEYVEQYAPKHCIFLGKVLRKSRQGQKGEIMIGGLVTTLAKSTGYKRELKTLTIVLGNTMLDLEVCLTMKLISTKDE